MSYIPAGMSYIPAGMSYIPAGMSFIPAAPPFASHARRIRVRPVASHLCTAFAAHAARVRAALASTASLAHFYPNWLSTDLDVLRVIGRCECGEGGEGGDVGRVCCGCRASSSEKPPLRRAFCIAVRRQ